MSTASHDYDVLAGVFIAWWRELQSLSKAGKPVMIAGAPKPPNRKALAELRRINTVAEAGRDVVDIGRALGSDAFRDLLLRLNSSDLHPQSKVRKWLGERSPQLEPFAIAAATVARVREDSGGVSGRPGATAKLLGDGFPDTHVFAEARFKRLLRCRDDWPDLMAQARRIAAILERKAPIGDLAASLVLWNAEPRIRRDWAFQYYQKSFEAPDLAPPVEPMASQIT